jgi:hypothetical protein
LSFFLDRYVGGTVSWANIKQKFPTVHRVQGQNSVDAAWYCWCPMNALDLSLRLRMPSVLIQTTLQRTRQFSLIVRIVGPLNSAYIKLSLQRPYSLQSPDGVNPQTLYLTPGRVGVSNNWCTRGYNCYLPTLHSSCAQLESLCYFGKDHQSHNTWLSSHLRNHVPATFVTTRQVTMSAEALQTLQTAAITLACLSGLFGEPHRSATTRQLNTKLLLINRHIYRTCCACDMGDVSACHGFIEETEMGHYRLVCACGVAVLCVSSSCVDSWISLPILLHALFNSRVHDT